MEMLSLVMVGFAFGFGVGALFVWWVMRRQVRDLEAGWRAERAQYGVWGAPKARPWPRPTPPAVPGCRINPCLSNCILEGGRPAKWAQAMIDVEDRPPVDAGRRPLPPIPPPGQPEPPGGGGIGVKWR